VINSGTPELFIKDEIQVWLVLLANGKLSWHGYW
jgi:hypothetical protein